MCARCFLTSSALLAHFWVIMTKCVHLALVIYDDQRDLACARGCWCLLLLGLTARIVDGVMTGVGVCAACLNPNPKSPTPNPNP